ncbi:MAG: deoxyhypusine synthase [Promethearchaeota archaeon]|nr:MAG: deoxyhypusine synthase [Candidatus Lokiarchaeota archaeon]
MGFNEKDKFLNEKIQPFNPYKIKNLDDLLNSLKYCGFQGRNLGIAHNILYKMVKDENCLTILTLSGAMVPAGMQKIIVQLLENNLIDVLVSTGANIIHDLIDSFLDGGHYIGSPHVIDDNLFEHRINRIYDTFLPEDNYIKTEKILLEFLKELYPNKIIDEPPSEFLNKLGSKIEQKSILSVSNKKGIPIFVPAISDSELALDLTKFTSTQDFKVNFKVIEDIKKFAEIVGAADYCGTFIIGGGVPRNWAQQIYPYIEDLERETNPDSKYEFGYKYSVRIHTATEYDGGLSGCTISESKSWGKYSLDSNYISLWCDATIALPVLVTGLIQRLKNDA